MRKTTDMAAMAISDAVRMRIMQLDEELQDALRAIVFCVCTHERITHVWPDGSTGGPCEVCAQRGSACEKYRPKR